MMPDRVTRAPSPEELEAFRARQADGTSATKDGTDGPSKQPEVTFAPSAKSREKTVTLEYPVLVDGVLVEEITCRRVIGEELMGLGSQNPAQNPIEKVTGFPISVVQALDADDFTAVMEAAMDFLPRNIRVPLEKAQAQARKTAESALTSGPNAPQKSPTS